MKDLQAYLTREPNLLLAQKMKWLIWILCGAVFALVLVMRSPYKIPVPEGYFNFLPPVHAALNSLVALLLVFALVAVKMGKIHWHKMAINGAMVVSIAFLLCYVAYHFTTVETRYGNLDEDPALSDIEKQQAGGMRYVYLCILLTHILFATVSLPLICFSWMYGITHQFKKHRRLVRWVYPMWLYVAVTGPVCYFMLQPYYQK